MSAPGFTPGPWRVMEPNAWWPGVEASDVSIVVWDAPKTEKDARDSEVGVQGNDHEEALANAHLIAAAPDLFEALEAVVAAFFASDPSVHERAMHKATAALTKARGEA